MKTCPKCNTTWDDSWKVCLHCNTPLVKSSDNVHPADISTKEPIEVEYYNTSILKLAILSVCTLGFYEIYWFYKNWKAIKDKTGEKISPFWRAWFAIFTCHDLFKRIIISAQKKGYTAVNSAGVLATAYVLLVLLGNASGRYSSGIALVDNTIWLISFATILPLIYIQNAINFHNSSINPSYSINGRFSWKAILLMLIGGFILILSLYGIFVPEQIYYDDGTPVNMQMHKATSLLEGMDKGNLPERSKMKQAYDILKTIKPTDTLTDEEKEAYPLLLKSSCEGVALSQMNEILEAFNNKNYEKQKELTEEFIAWVVANSEVLTGDKDKMLKFINEMEQFPDKSVTIQEFDDMFREKAQQYAKTEDDVEFLKRVADVIVLYAAIEIEDNKN